MKTIALIFLSFLAGCGCYESTAGHFDAGGNDDIEGFIPDAPDPATEYDGIDHPSGDADVVETPLDGQDPPPPWCSGENIPCSGSPMENEICIPGGTFLMGSREGFGEPDEWPIHSIWLHPFYMDRYEVTNGQYRECVADGSCEPPRNDLDWCLPFYDSEKNNYPVICVTREQAVAYCRYVGKRLPTEAEWEKAARGTDGRIYPWGDDPPTCERVGAALAGCGGDYGPVGSYPSSASPYGVEDMATGTGELVLDAYCAEAYGYLDPWCDPCLIEWGDPGPECVIVLPDNRCGAREYMASYRGGSAVGGMGMEAIDLRISKRRPIGYGGIRCVRPAGGW